MKSTKKGNQYYFGLKAHIGVDAGSGYVHTVKVTPANVHDITVASGLLRPDDNTVYGDSVYIGLEKREEIVSDKDRQITEFRINKRYGSVKKTPSGHDWDWQIEKKEIKGTLSCGISVSYNKEAFWILQSAIQRSV